MANASTKTTKQDEAKHEPQYNGYKLFAARYGENCTVTDCDNRFEYGDPVFALNEDHAHSGESVCPSCFAKDQGKSVEDVLPKSELPTAEDTPDAKTDDPKKADDKKTDANK